MTLKHARERLNLTQEQVADQMGIHRNTYLSIENNVIEAHLSKLLDICIFLDVDICEVIKSEI